MAAFTKDFNKKNPNVRNNSSEFALCSRFLREFKVGALPYLRQIKEGKLHSNLMKRFMEIKNLDKVSPFGSAHVYYGLQTEKGKALLRNFVFTPYAKICSQLGNPEVNMDDFTISWKKVDASYLSFPTSGTHCELSFLLLEYDPEKEMFTTYEGKKHRFSKVDSVHEVSLVLEDDVVRREGHLYIFLGGMKFLEVWSDEEYESGGRGGFGIEVFGVG